VTVDDTVQSLSPAMMAILRALAMRPGSVVARSELLRALPGSATDPHAVDTAVLRLRKALGDRNIVVTVVKRGYRLAIDETSGAA
jgi:uroporphyrinogen-III synthase